MPIRPSELWQKLVYVAGHYTKNPVHCTRDAIFHGEKLLEIGAIPYIPHIAMFWDAVCPHKPDFWYWYDMQILERCDAMLIIDEAETESLGVQMEVARAIELGIPIYRSDDLWAS